MTVIPERAHWLKSTLLSKGIHLRKTPGRWCLMEAAAYIAGEPWSDHPKCVSRVLTAYGIGLNDSWGDDQRQKLVPFIPRMLGTADDGQDEARSYLALDWLARTATPAWLDLAGFSQGASALRDHPRIVDVETLHSIRAVVSAQSRARWAPNELARSVAYPETYSAGHMAANMAAYEGVYEVEHEEVYEAAYEAVYEESRSAACSAAYEISHLSTYREMKTALAPTVKTLQASALDLFDAMIDPSAVTA